MFNDYIEDNQDIMNIVRRSIIRMNLNETQSSRISSGFNIIQNIFNIPLVNHSAGADAGAESNAGSNAGSNDGVFVPPIIQQVIQQQGGQPMQQILSIPQMFQMFQIPQAQIQNYNSLFGALAEFGAGFSAGISAGILNQMPLMEPVKFNVSQEEVNKIPLIEFDKLDEKIKESNISCTICLTDFEKEENVRLVKCNHVFHSECLNRLLLDCDSKYNNLCPTCRTEIAQHVANIE
jgi:hypothetical protein